MALAAAMAIHVSPAHLIVVGNTYTSTVRVLLLAAVQAHPLHSLLHAIHTAIWASLELAKRYAVVLVICRQFLPLLDPWNAGGLHRSEGIIHSPAGAHIPYFDERDWDQAGTTETSDGLCDEPFGIRLGDDNDGFASLRVQLIRSLCIEVINNDAVYHGAFAGTRISNVIRASHCIISVDRSQCWT